MRSERRFEFHTSLDVQIRIGEVVAELAVIVVIESGEASTRTNQIREHIGSQEQQTDFILHFGRMHYPNRFWLVLFDFETLSAAGIFFLSLISEVKKRIQNLHQS